MKGIIILSGGLDSTTLLYKLWQEGYELYALSFLYGQRHSKELQFAKYWGERSCIEHKILEIPLQQVSKRSALTDHTKSLPEDHYTHQNQEITVVSNRNMVMLSFAIAYAEDLGIDKVFYAAHQNDRAIYPDCRKEYVQALSLASKLGTYSHVEVIAPFVDLIKAEIIALGLKLGIDYSKTWSCYAGQERPCLKCATCLERTEAFLVNKVKDPLLTDKEWKQAVDIYQNKMEEQ